MEQSSELRNLGNLNPAPGSNKKRKRIGRGIGSGTGKTAGKGHKGQHARKGGGKVRAGFEGGQMPLYMRLPKRGFKNHFRVEFNVLNVEQLNRFDDGAEVSPELLKKSNLLKNPDQPIKILGRGKLEKKLNISVHKVSKSAQSLIEGAGGQLKILSHDAIIIKDEKAIEAKRRKRAKKRKK